MGKRGIFFSTDALIALAIILMGVLVIYPFISIGTPNSFVQEDIVKVLSSLKVGDVDNTYVAELIANGDIVDLNKSLLEQIGEFYVLNKTLSKNLAESVFDDIATSANFGIWFGDELVASRNTSRFEDATDLVIESQTISGIQDGNNLTAFSSRAFLSNSLQNEYFYFGGYVGEGNLSALIDYTGTIQAATMELAISKDFSVYINGVHSGDFSASPSVFIPSNYTLPIINFNSGGNIIELRGDSLNIAGGFIRISYRQTAPANSQKFYLPGIDGIINFYGGLYIPEIIIGVSMRLHYNNSLTTFFNVGNVTVYNGTVSGPVNITDTTDLDFFVGGVDYVGTTLPLRFGIANASYVTDLVKPADVYSVTDLSGSMQAGCSGTTGWCCLLNSWCSTEATCATCSGTWDDKITSAKEANSAFINSILNNSINQIGLAGYRDTASNDDFHFLSQDNASLQAEVSSWVEGGATCICCGINKAMDELAINSSPSKFRSMVVMSDGLATRECSRQNTNDPKTDAIAAACEAYNTYAIKVYAVGFGADADETTLQAVADCGNGSYYYSTVNGLKEIYESIAREIIEASFFEQTLNVTGNHYSRLYPDSYIELIYNESALPFGLITTTEKEFDDEDSGSFSLPPNSTILETTIISYSGPRWTQEVLVNGITAYNLSEYMLPYIDLGDPYSIKIPNNYILQDNVINLTTGLSPGNSSEGSSKNKIIYTVVRDNVAAYSSLSTTADGCTWTIEFEDTTTLISKVPTSYAGSESCTYTSAGQTISNSNDAMQVAVKKLLEGLDYDSDGRLDVKFTDQDLEISASEISGIPFDWSTNMQVRTWN